MSFTERSGFKTQEGTEAMGHMVERGVAEFLGSGAFDCIENISRTKNDGVNDNKGIDLIVEFKNGSKIAIDITTIKENDPRFLDKWKSMVRNPMAAVAEERDADGQVTLEKSSDSMPRAIVRVDATLWDEYMGYDPAYAPDLLKERIEGEKKDIVNQIIRQVDVLLKSLKGLKEYRKKAEPVKKMLLGELEDNEQDIAA